MSSRRARRRHRPPEGTYRQFGGRWKRFDGQRWVTLPKQRSGRSSFMSPPMLDRIRRATSAAIGGSVANPPEPNPNINVRTGEPE